MHLVLRAYLVPAQYGGETAILPLINFRIYWALQPRISCSTSWSTFKRLLTLRLSPRLMTMGPNLYVKFFQDRQQSMYVYSIFPIIQYDPFTQTQTIPFAEYKIYCKNEMSHFKIAYEMHYTHICNFLWNFLVPACFNQVNLVVCWNTVSFESCN